MKLPAFFILVFGAAALTFLLLNMPFLQAAADIGANLSPFTANVTHWQGWTETMNFYPLALVILLLFFVIFAWWHAKN